MKWPWLNGGRSHLRHILGISTTTTTTKYYYYYYYYYYVRLSSFFQDNLAKLAPEKQNHSGRTNLDLLEIVSCSGISYANLHLAPDR